MTISSAFSNAASGLGASARAVQVASANIANALTPGYAPRTLDLVAATRGGGVQMAGISRAVDPGLLSLHRDSGAASQGAARAQAFWTAIETAVGLPGQGLSAALSAFDSALILASDRPDLDDRLAHVARTADGLATAMAQASATIQDQRAAADAALTRDIAVLNTGLHRVDALNDQIVRQQAAGQSTLGLLDERQALISTLSEIVPMREHPRADGRVMLFSTGGALLLDLEAAQMDFVRAGDLDATMGVGTGLSPVTLRGHAFDGGAPGVLEGGRLAANLRLRDIDAPRAQSDLDALAANLIDRFAHPQTDSTLPAAAPGLFTDAGFLAGTSSGLAGRLAVNSAVLPDHGGALRRLRDGIGSVAPGALGDASRLQALSGALDRRVSPAPGQPALSFAGSLGALMTRVSSLRHDAEGAATTTAARHAEVSETLLAHGVNTDAEMQRLLQIEQAYAANARVIETADAMLRRLMEI